MIARLQDQLLDEDGPVPPMSVCGRKEKAYLQIRAIAIEYKWLENQYRKLSKRTRRDLNGPYASERIFAATILGASSTTLQIAGLESSQVLYGQDVPKSTYPGLMAVCTVWFAPLTKILRDILKNTNYNEDQYRTFFRKIGEEVIQLDRIHGVMYRLIEENQSGVEASENCDSLWIRAYYFITQHRSIDHAVLIARAEDKRAAGKAYRIPTGIRKDHELSYVDMMWFSGSRRGSLKLKGPNATFADDDQDCNNLALELEKMSLQTVPEKQHVQDISMALTLYTQGKKVTSSTKKPASSSYPDSSNATTKPTDPLSTKTANIQPTSAQIDASPSVSMSEKQGERSESQGAERMRIYNERWNSLGPKDTGYPYPSPNYTQRGFLNVDDIDCAEDICKSWNVPTRIIVNTKTFFLGGFDIIYNIDPEDDNYPEGDQLFSIPSVNDFDVVKKLIRHIKLKEMSRWHPDRLNKRTGGKTGVDVAKGVEKGVVEIRTALQELLEELNLAVQYVEEVKRMGQREEEREPAEEGKDESEPE